MIEQATEAKTCLTCLYCATHDNCDGCLNTEEDYAVFRETNIMPEFRFLNWIEGNWLARVMRHELEGKRNIVIGGQGEAEVNTKWTPKETAKHLHYVSEQCGYLCGNLRIGSLAAQISIATNDGRFELVWYRDGNGASGPWHLEYIWQLNDDGTSQSSWSREPCEIFPPEAAEPSL